jgi:hypothetical protein
VHKAGQITENEIKRKNMSATGKTVQSPAGGFGIKTAMLINCNGVLLMLTLLSCKKA